MPLPLNQVIEGGKKSTSATWNQVTPVTLYLILIWLGHENLEDLEADQGRLVIFR